MNKITTKLQEALQSAQQLALRSVPISSKEPLRKEIRSKFRFKMERWHSPNLQRRW